MVKSWIVRFIEIWFSSTQFLINIWMLKDKIRFYHLIYNGRVLDIGAGTKPYRHLFNNVKEYIGTNTRRHYDINHIQPDDSTTDVWIEDGTKLPFPDNSFDGVVCFQVLPLIADPKAFFTEVQRVLKPWGYFMLTSDYLYPAWSNEDYMRHSQSHLVKLANENNFIVLSTESFGGFWTMIYCNIIRYFRSYPQRIKMVKNPLFRLWRTMFLILIMLLSPIVGVLGPLVYILERGKRRDYGQTMNQLLLARKQL